MPSNAPTDETCSATLIREFSTNDITPEFVQEWIALESRALEPNVYVSPHFCLAAAKHLTPELKPIFIAIYANHPSQLELIGLAVVVLHPPCKEFPLTHLVCYESIHSYLSGIILDRRHAQSAVNEFIAYLSRKEAPWHGLRINNWSDSASQGQLMRSAFESKGIFWHTFYAYERACLSLGSIDDTTYLQSFERAGGKDLDRRVRRLKELGEVSTRVLRGPDVTHATLDRFLLLEDREWAHAQKTSLFAAGHEAFFRQVCEPLMAESRLFFSEICIDGQPVASAANFISGDCGFAFKIGWDQSLAKMSPGIINELWFLKDVRTTCADMNQIDSGATAGSFIEKIWPGRKTISSGIFITSRRARWITRAMDGARVAKQHFVKNQQA